MVHVPQELYLPESAPRIHFVVKRISHLLDCHFLLGLGVHSGAARGGGGGGRGEKEGTMQMRWKSS